MFFSLYFYIFFAIKSFFKYKCFYKVYKFINLKQKFYKYLILYFFFKIKIKYYLN